MIDVIFPKIDSLVENITTKMFNCLKEKIRQLHSSALRTVKKALLHTTLNQDFVCQALRVLLGWHDTKNGAAGITISGSIIIIIIIIMTIIINYNNYGDDNSIITIFY